MKLDGSVKAKIAHPWQRRLYAASALFSILLLALTVLSLVAQVVGWYGEHQVPNWLGNLLTGAFLLSIVVPGFLTFVRMLASVKPIYEGIVISEQQYPEINLIFQEICDNAGLTPEQRPRLVVAGGNRELGACHCFGRRSLIVVHSDLVEARWESAERVEYPALRFELGRQVGLLVAGERRFISQFFSMVPTIVPYLSRVFTRAEDCTADRWGALLSSPEAAIAYCGFLAVGKRLWSEVNVSQLVVTAGAGLPSETISTWWMTHPPVAWRAQGLAVLGAFSDADQKPGVAATKQNSYCRLSPLPLKERFTELDWATATAFWRRPENQILT